MRLPLLVFHISAGVLAMFAGAAAMSFRKGSRWHGKAGNIFVAAMLCMAAAASCLAYMKHQTNNVFGGILTIYMVATAWATARRRDRETGTLDWLGCLFALTIGVLSVIHGFQKATGRVASDGSPGFMDIFMGSVILLAGIGDLRAGARNFRQTTNCAASLAHVLWVVYCHRLVLPGAATGISRLVAWISRAFGAGPSATDAADFLADSSSIHERIPENVDAGSRTCLFARELTFVLISSQDA
jgi:uncharacterized membrane protein